MKFLNKLFGRATAEEPSPPPVEEEVVSVSPEETPAPDSEVVVEVEPSEGAEPSEQAPDPFESETELQSEASAVPQDREALWEALSRDPEGVELHSAVLSLVSDPKERVDFYHRLMEADAAQPYHSLSLGRAFRQAGQARESIGHYQLYLRSVTEAPVLEELAEVFEELGESYLADSSRMVAESLRKRG